MGVAYYLAVLRMPYWTWSSGVDALSLVVAACQQNKIHANATRDDATVARATQAFTDAVVGRLFVFTWATKKVRPPERFRLTHR